MFQKFSLTVLLGVGVMLSAVRGQQAETLRGKVIDASTRVPLANAIVALAASGRGTITNSAGEFALAAHAANDSLVVRFIGYQTQRLALAALRVEQSIALTPTTVLFREVTVTAKRYAATAADIPTASEVINTQASRFATAQNLGETMAQAQSLFIKEYGGLSGLKTVTLRGASEGQVLVLEDGFRLNNPQGGWVDFNLLPANSAEKIEVVRGGASAQYGSEAVGGVIHIRTLAPPERFTPSAEYTLGSYGTNAARFSIGQSFGKLAARASFNKLQTEGDYEIDASARLRNNAFTREDVYLRADFSFSPTTKLSVFHKDIRGDREVAGSLAFPSPMATQVDDNRLTGVSFIKQKGQWLDLNAQASVQRLMQEYANPDPFFPVASRHRVDGRELIVHNRSRLAPFELLYGFELAHNEITSTDILNPTREQRSAFAQTEWRVASVQHDRLASFTLLPAIRVDDYSDAGAHASPKLGAVWKWERRASVSLHASAGKSFRVPSMNDLFWPSGPFVAGNPNLKPEEGQQYDAGVLLQLPSTFGNWRLGFDAFHYRLTNLISWIPDANFRFSPQNIARAKVTGFEPALQWHAPHDRVMLRVSYAKLEARDNGDDPATRDKKLLYRPEHKLDASATLQIGSANLGASYQLISERFARQDNSLALPGYRLTSVFGNCDFALAEGYRARIAAALNNLFNRRIQIIEGYPTPGREFRLTAGVGR
jgi:outer membrane cobalamin receptor